MAPGSRDVNAFAPHRAQSVLLEGVTLRFIGKADLLREKLRAGTDPARRRSGCRISPTRRA